jgi:hypothetical protein
MGMAVCVRVLVSSSLCLQLAEVSSSPAHCIFKVTDSINHMSTSTRPSSSAEKPTESQKTAADTAMPAGGFAKLTVTNEQEPSMQLTNLINVLSCRAGQAGMKNLLSDTKKLREWQMAARPTHKQRDDMMKLGPAWNVPQKSHGKKRNPGEVAQDLEKEFMETAQRLLKNKTPFGHTCSAAKSTHDDHPAHGTAAHVPKAARGISGRSISNAGVSSSATHEE